jgi:hypothetical protein
VHSIVGFFFHNTLRRIHWLGHFDPDRQQLLSVRLDPALWLARATYSWNRIRHRRVPEWRQPKRSPSRQERGEVLGPEFAGCIYWTLTFRSPWRRLSLPAREATKAGFSTEPNVCSHSSLFPPEDDAAWNKGHGRIERSQIARVGVSPEQIGLCGCWQVIAVRRQRIQLGPKAGKNSDEIGYYATSIGYKELTDQEILQAIRDHWAAIESGSHYRVTWPSGKIIVGSQSLGCQQHACGNLL